MKYVLIIGILCIAALEAIALLKGVNGSILRIVIASLTGIIGLSIKTPNILKKAL